MSDTPAAPVTEKIDPAPAAPAATTPAPTTPAPAAPATIASGNAPTTAPAQPDWPSDWRQKLASDDPDAIKTLERIAAPTDLWKSYKSLREKLSSGEVKTKLPDNPTPEQIAEYRKSIGVPEKPEDYKIELPNGVVFGEADKPLVDSFKKVAHDANLDPKSVNQMLAWYTDNQQKVQAQIADKDEANRSKVEEQLRREWGPEYKTADGTNGQNLNAIANLFADAPEGLFDSIVNSRDGNGGLLGDNPNVIKFFAHLGRELFPTATLIPMGADASKSTLDRKADIEKMMAEKKSDYWKGPKAEALQAEYREILGSLERANARRAA